MIRWLGWEIGGSGDHGIRTCQGRGVTDCMSIMFLVASCLILTNALAHTQSTSENTM
jgi:hypothetical protein